MERLPKLVPKAGYFVFPNLAKERGEIERVAQKYSPNNPEAFARELYIKAQESVLIDLTENMWRILDNTDSFDISPEDWEKVNEHIEHTNKEAGATRNWQDLKQKVEQGQELDAPIVLKYQDELHLVSGNTRLMVARALGKTPKILFVEM